MLADLVPANHFTGPGTPLELLVEPSEDDAVQKVVGATGGAVSATGPDGTLYTLEVPAGALLMDTSITVTPLADVTGYPFAAEPEHRVGVHLEPNGLEFQVEATLTIQPQGGVTPGSVAVLSYRGQGHDAGVELPDESADRLTLPIDHFSGYTAVWPIKEPEWRQLARQQQELAEWRHTSELNTLLAFRRGLILGGADPDTLFSDRDLAREYMPLFVREILQPRLEAAGVACSEGQRAIATWFGFWRTLQLLGVADDPAYFPTIGATTYTRASDLPEAVLQNTVTTCQREALQRCLATGDFFGLYRVFFSLLRVIELLGREMDPEWGRQLLDDADRCGRWKLEMATTFVVEELPDACCAPTGSFDSTIDLRWKAGDGVDVLTRIINAKIEGEGDMERLSIQFGGALCHVTTTTPQQLDQAVAKLTSLEWEYPDDPAAPGWAESGYPIQLGMSVNPGSATTTYTAECDGTIAIPAFPYPFPLGEIVLAFGGAFADREEPEKYPLMIEVGWEFTSANPFRAHRQLQRTGETFITPVTMTVDLTLDHQPG